MNTSPSSPQSSGHRAWLMPAIAIAVALVIWALNRQPQPGRDAATPTAEAPASPAGESSPSQTPSPAERFAANRPAPSLESAPDDSGQAPAITPELRQERADLFQKLAEGNDATLDAVKRAFEPHGPQQPDVLASGWILAQHWAIAARAEEAVASRIEDPVQREQLAEIRHRILIQSAVAELRGLLESTPDPRVLTELEAIGRGLKDSPPVAKELLPNRPAVRTPRPSLPPEE